MFSGKHSPSYKDKSQNFIQKVLQKFNVQGRIIGIGNSWKIALQIQNDGKRVSGWLIRFLHFIHSEHYDRRNHFFKWQFHFSVSIENDRIFYKNSGAYVWNCQLFK